MKAVVERSDDPVPSGPEADPAAPPARARFAAFAILFGLGSGAALFAVLSPDAGWPVLLLLCSICLSLSCLAAMLVFRRVQLPLEAVHSLNAEQALRLQAFEDLSQQADVTLEIDAPAPPFDELALLRTALTEAQGAADALRRQTQALVAASDEHLLLIGRDGRIEAASPAAAALIDKTAAELLDRPLASLLPLFDDSRPEPLQHPLTAALLRLFADAAPERQGFAALLERRGRTSVQLRLDARPLRDPANRVQALLLRLDPLDADAPVVRTDPATRLEALDPLTQAFGQQHLSRRIEQLNAEAQIDGTHHGLLLIAPDQLDRLHDRFGIAAGEQRLWQLAQTIREAAASAEDFHRISGSHFALLLPRQSVETCIDRAEQLCAAVAGQVWPCDGGPLSPSFSIGLVTIDGQLGTDAQLASAAEALRRAQQSGGGRVQQAVNEAIDADWLHGKLLDGQALRLAAQAILPADPAPGATEAPWLELLLRLQDDDGVWLPLDPWWPQIERLGLGIKIDDWLLDQALRHDLGSTRLSIRLSSPSLLRDDFLEVLRARLLRSRVPTPQLCIAVDEAFIVDHPQRAAALRELLSPFGCSLAIDRYRGGSGLTALRQFPANYLRLHESLVARFTTDLIDRAHLEWLVTAARMMGAKTVACAVRDADSQERMRLAKVDYVQGYAVAPPVPFSS